MLRSLRELSTNAQIGTDPRGLQQLSTDALQQAQKLEFDIRRRVDTTSDELVVSSADEAPPKYRPMLDEYFRELSRRSGTAIQQRPR
jgi:hypothetical protein